MNSQLRDRLKQKQGFTLIETIVAILIFGTASVAFTYAYMASLRVQFTSQNHYAANNIARNRISRAMTLGYDNMWVLGENTTKVDESGNIDGDGKFERTTSVTPWGTNCNQIVVQVQFSSVSSTNMATVEVRTIIALGM